MPPPRAVSELCFFLLAMLAAVSGCSETETTDVQLIVSADGHYVLQGKSLALSELPQALRALKEQKPGVNLHVVSAPTATYAHIAPAMQLAQELGLAKVGFTTATPSASAPTN